MAQLLIFPVGKAWARWMPDVGFTAFGRRFSLNPDRNFNQKEHMLATIMANTGFSTPYTSNIILTQFLPQYCEFHSQTPRLLGLTGPDNQSYAVWPTSLVTIALNKALHEGNDSSPVQGPFGKVFRASRMKCFLFAFGAMFLYFWVGDTDSSLVVRAMLI